MGHKRKKVLGGFEPPSLDSESRVLTVTPQDRVKRGDYRWVTLDNVFLAKFDGWFAK